jgi:hypothetical protein
MIRFAIGRVERCPKLARVAVELVILATLAGEPSRALAQNSGSFTLKISEKEMKLEHPTDMMWDKYLMWDLAFQRMNDRNMPYIELSNAATSTAPITEFHMTIGDSRFNFDDDVMGKFAMLGSSTPGFSIASGTVGNLGNELVISIGSGGLQPGQLVRFKIDLAVDPEFEDEFFKFPDYRTVLFDMNGFNVYDGLQQQNTADNGQAWVVFDPALGANFATQPVPLADEIVSGAAADFYNNNYRRYGETDPVRTFLLNGGGSGVVPEPQSVLFVMFAVLAGLACNTRPRRVLQAK